MTPLRSMADYFPETAVTVTRAIKNYLLMAPRSTLKLSGNIKYERSIARQGFVHDINMDVFAICPRDTGVAFWRQNNAPPCEMHGIFCVLVDLTACALMGEWYRQFSPMLSLGGTY